VSEECGACGRGRNPPEGLFKYLGPSVSTIENSPTTSFQVWKYYKKFSIRFNLQLPLKSLTTILHGGGCRGPKCYETSRPLYFVDDRFTDGRKVVRFRRRPPCVPERFLVETESTPGPTFHIHFPHKSQDRSYNEECIFELLHSAVNCGLLNTSYLRQRYDGNSPSSLNCFEIRCISYCQSSALLQYGSEAYI
jgi:hypothetical protein